MKAWELSKVLTIFRERAGEGTIIRLQLFANVAAAGHAGIEQGVLLKAGGLNRSTVSAALHDLSPLSHRKTEGMGLLQIRVDPSNLRVNIVTLTPKGEALALEMFA